MGEESYCIDVVLFLQAPVVPSMGFHTAAVSARNQPYYLNQVNSQSTSSYYSYTPLFSVDRLLPRLSPLCFKCDEFVPLCDNQNLCDVPIGFYRRQRVRRAIGAIPSETILPPSLSPHLGNPISGRIRRGQFSLDYNAALWNAQALFAADPFKHTNKAAYVSKLMLHADFGMFTEAHGTNAGNRAWKGPLHTTSWWSCGASTGHAGVGIIVKNEFLENFAPGPEIRSDLARKSGGATSTLVFWFPRHFRGVFPYGCGSQRRRLLRY